MPVDIELSVSCEQAKSRALAILGQRGYRAASGPVRLAYPFAILVEGVPVTEVDAVLRLVSQVDPCAGRITVSARAPERLRT